MIQDHSALYTALASRDPRFDGVFYVGVTSTGIYCRPVCTARTPKAANCRFFASAETAEKANFRPCLRCRPELAPGNAPVDDGRRIAGLVAQRIVEGMLDDPHKSRGLENVADQFGWSSRQIRRMVQKELGVSPIELVLTRRLLLAKQLLTETSLPIIEVAYASGFSSLRRFNDAFVQRYRMPPTRFRKDANGRAVATSAESFTLQLAYRPPYDWAHMLGFLAARAMQGVELVDGDSYLRTVRLGDHRGWIRVRNAPDKRALLVELTHTLTPALPALLGRLRNLFDLSARPDVVGAHLSRDPRLARSVRAFPGLRVPGAFDGFELAVRAILGQQVTVKAATTLAARFAQRFGDGDATPHAGLDRFAPTAARVARARPAELARLGILGSRARAIVALARACDAGSIDLGAGADPAATIARLQDLPGVGAWTAEYIAMRALRWPDAFPRGDVVLRRKLGGASPARAEELSRPWQPWRSYATLYLWHENGIRDG